LAAALGCWLQTSVVGWLTNLVVLATLLILTMLYDRPGAHLVRAPFAWVYPLCGLGALASVVRVGSLGWPHISSTAMGVVVFCLVLLAYVVAGLRQPGHEQLDLTLSFPLRSGRWTVTAGGVSALNHHLAVQGQSGAVDLVALRPDGARAAGVCPRRLKAYAAYGRGVVSPCDGIVVASRDGDPDQLGQRIHSGPPAGNHVRIDTGHGIVQLSHLRPGTVSVAVGDTVVVGQQLGEVGSSGHSAEPHLHIHAEHDGRGLRLRFTDLARRRLRPGVVVTPVVDSPAS